jgi:tRNA(Arg) A34 adenosine deaminase TadA
MDTDHTRFMKVALEEAALATAEGNIGVGSVIVRDGVVVERGHNTVDSTLDLTAHAETMTLRRLSLRLRRPIPRYQTGPGLLAGHVLYTTVEPCAMCAFACCIADVSTIVIGGRFAGLGVTTPRELRDREAAGDDRALHRDRVGSSARRVRRRLSGQPPPIHLTLVAARG